jgi:hypothetical protein
VTQARQQQLEHLGMDTPFAPHMTESEPKEDKRHAKSLLTDGVNHIQIAETTQGLQGLLEN